MNFTILGTILGSLSGISAFLVVLFSRREVKAKAELTAVDATSKALEMVWETIDRQKLELTNIRVDMLSLAKSERECKERLEILKRDLARLRASKN